jgi:hypothetical protein
MSFTVATLFQPVILGENLPMTTLLRSEEPRSLANGTDVFQCCQNGCPDKLGTIRDSLQGSKELSISFESDDFPFNFRHNADLHSRSHPTKALWYYFIIPTQRMSRIPKLYLNYKAHLRAGTASRLSRMRTPMDPELLL